MTQPIERDAIYRRRRFPRDVIETCVRWYLTYRLSYRDLVALMAERDVHLTHTTIMRWVFRFVPEYEKRWNRRAKPVGSSWRVDETFIHTRPKMGYLYRAVDKDGKTVDSLFQIGRGIAAAMAFFRKALASCAPRWPRKITLDGHIPSHSGLRRLRREDYRWKYVLVRRSCYLNNVVEQDHRAIKGRCQPMLGFKSYRTAAVTLAGLELVHRIRKRQFKFGPGWWSRWSLKKQWERALREVCGPGPAYLTPNRQCTRSAADDTLGVLRRGRGTCSSRHRFLAALAHECGQGCVASSSAIMSISTQAQNGSCATLTALREWMPRSPNT